MCGRTYTPRFRPPLGRHGFTLVELLVVIGIIALLISILLPSLNRAREQANRIKCASNLRQLAMAGLIYASENRGQFPRTYWEKHPDTPAVKHQVPDDSNRNKDNAYSLSNPRGPVGTNNVSASFYHLLKSTDLTAEAFLCPSTDATRTWAGGGSNQSVQDKTNFAKPYKDFCSYSYNSPFGDQDAVNKGRTFNSSTTPDMPFAADINPGNSGNMANGDTRGSRITTHPFNASKKDQARANSNNHRNEGQNVVYVDAHVEWNATQFAGPQVRGHAYRDPIYQEHNGPLPTGTGGGWENPPRHAQDALLLPTDDQNN